MMLEDPGGELEIQEVSTEPTASRFRPYSEFEGKLTDGNTYWVRLALENPGPIPEQIALHAVGKWNEVQLHSGHGGPDSVRRTGMLVPHSEREIHVIANPVFGVSYLPVTAVLAAESVTLLHLRLTTDWRFGPLEWLAVDVRDLALVIAEERRIRLVMGVFGGIFLALGLYHLLLMLALRDLSYGYYVLHIAGTALISLYITGVTSEYFWPQAPEWDVRAFNLWRMFAMVGLVQFARIFLKTRERQPRLDVALRILVGAGILITASIPVVPHLYVSESMGLCFVMSFLLVFWTGIAAQLQGDPLARYFLAGNVFTILGVAIAVLSELGPLKAISWSNFAPMGGITLEALMLSQGLAYRVNLMRDEIANARIREERAQIERGEERRRLLEHQAKELERQVAERTVDLQRERERSESLLRNMLPDTIAEELKETGRSQPRRHEEVSILFTDFAGFTQTVSTIPPHRMVQELNEIFLGFDTILDRHGLEKIKTIGDACMAAAGVPEPLSDHASRAVSAALEMQSWMARRNEESAIKWGLRIGIHSGPIVAGVIGSRKYAYDIWGDTVNIASRMESSGAVGRVNVSAYTYELVRDRFRCEYRGKVSAKGKGEIDMYFVVGEQHASTGDR